ncbi:Intradiol ring-cleavage dioxygenase [Limtongia smithiae]|uniref:Intradiol ring-cleavage dioxygenase n=1 Tax=Limtongia smithiae TaxID=1125753 RepID=UPI0034CE9660
MRPCSLTVLSQLSPVSDSALDSAMPSQTLDPYTASVINATGPATTPRVRQVFSSMIAHLHDFLRENKVTVDEWMLGVDMINRIGKMSDERRNEGILVCDVLGVESLVDALTYDLESNDHTKSAIIGPFYRENSPQYPNGASIIQKDLGGDRAVVHGHVKGVDGLPIKGARVEVWHTAPNGLYEQQDPEQPEYNLRGTFFTDDNGYYEFVGLRPTSYPIPFDGPAGDILQLLDRHPYRPGHIHFLVSAPGHRRLITQIFDSEDPYVENDSVFAVKGELVVTFQPSTSEKAPFEVVYDVVLPTSEEVAAYESTKKK